MASNEIVGIQTHNEFLIKHLKEALKLNPNELVKDKLLKCLTMVEGLEYYLETLSPQESELQAKIYNDTMDEPWEEHWKNKLIMFPYERVMISSRHSSQFLKLIAEITRAEKILEIGMFTGYTATGFCEAEFTKEVTTLEIDQFVTNFVKSRVAGTDIEKKLNIIHGAAMDSLHKLKEQKKQFDLIFIDADKVNYINYYKYILENDLLKQNGVMLLDNTLWKGEIYPTPSSERGTVFWELNEFIKNDSRVSQVIVQVCDGISLIRKK